MALPIPIFEVNCILCFLISWTLKIVESELIKRPGWIDWSAAEIVRSVQLVDQVDCNVNVEKHWVTLLRCIYLNVYKLSQECKMQDE